jgi:anthranilate phosphoribosyltransferase
MTLQTTLQQLLDGKNLTKRQARETMGLIMTGEATPAQIAGLLIALRLKGETVDEIAGFARAMLDVSVPVPTSSAPLVDVCGTGGDGHGTFNISTTVAFVVAGAGLPVAKHGNRSVSSRCGSADVLEALGVSLDLSPIDVGRAIDEIGIGFLFAPRFHPAMKHAIGPRREMGVRTVFNVVGPLVNPARVGIQLLGVFDDKLVEPMAEVLRELGCSAGAVVYGAAGMDELSTLGPNRVARIHSGRIEILSIDPVDLGLPRATLADVRGGEAAENAKIVRAVLGGDAGPKRDVVLLNAAAVVWIAGQADSMAEGLRIAAESIDSGAALDRLDRLAAFTAAHREVS